MKTEGDLQVYDLILTVRSPLFIGSGVSYVKKEYNYDGKNVTIYDERKFCDFMMERGLLEQYIDYIRSSEQTEQAKQKDLYQFLVKDCKLKKDWKATTALERYRVRAEKVKGDLHAFQRDSQSRAYVPGSSVKGALRTAWLLHEVLKEDPAGHSASDFRTDGSKGFAFPEEKYLNRLKLDQKQTDSAVNDLFRGVQISDSKPLDSSRLAVFCKEDVTFDGKLNEISMCRECVVPGTPVWCKLTLDQSVLRGRITKELLEQAVREFDACHRQLIGKFPQPSNAANLPQMPCLVLGGGAGFFSKTLAYPYLGEEAGLDWAVQTLTGHSKDRARGISPATMKYTYYNGKLYPFGFCEVRLQ